MFRQTIEPQPFTMFRFKRIVPDLKVCVLNYPKENEPVDFMTYMNVASFAELKERVFLHFAKLEFHPLKFFYKGKIKDIFQFFSNFRAYYKLM